MPLKSSVKRYELPLDRFSNVALPAFLQQLRVHQLNIEKYKSDGEWERVTKETLSGQRVITQLKAAIREVEEVGQQLPPKEEKEFSRSVEPHIKKASNAIRSFTVATQASNSFLCDTGSAEANDTVSSADKTTIAIQLNHQVLPEEVEIEQRKAQLEAVENLQQDIEDLQVLFNQFAQHVQEQATPVNQIEEHVETALVNVQEGERSLAKAARMKAALFPLTGALLGTCIGGPVGLFAGLKVGAVAALGGTFLGFTSGRVVKKWQEKEAEVPNTTTEDYHLVRSQSAPCGLQDPIQSQNPLPKTSTIDVGISDKQDINSN